MNTEFGALIKIEKKPTWKILRYFVFAVLLTLPLDQWTKENAREQLLIHEDQYDSTVYQGRREEIIAFQISNTWLTLHKTYVRNHGASWGFMSAANENVRNPVLILTGVLFAGGLLWGAVLLDQKGSHLESMSLVSMVSGSLGNFIDRVRLGFVVDFITIRSGRGPAMWALPSFNVADIIIVFSLICLIASLIFRREQKVTR